ncbi:unnamed protein product [Camellia sinensis]
MDKDIEPSKVVPSKGVPNLSKGVPSKGAPSLSSSAERRMMRVSTLAI